MKIVVIGSGAAGISALQTIRASNPDKNIHLALISAERELAYSPCALPYVISDSIPYKRLGRLESTFYKKNKIQTSWGSPVCRVNPDKKSIALKNGKTFFYDKLLLATGSIPIKPDIPGIDKTGVFFVDTLKNTRRIKNYIRKEKIAKRSGRVAVIGAGFTGIETALALRQQGINVIVIEMLDRILAKVLDDDFARITHKKINALPPLSGEKEIEFKLSAAVTEIKGKTKVKSVHLNNGKDLPVDMVIVSVGVRPNIDFLKDSGIALTKGIVVNDRMQTNLPDIYAAGDAVETVDYITGQPTISAIWPNAIEQGKVAGLNMLGEAAAEHRSDRDSESRKGQETHYPGASSINVLNLEGLPVISMGKIFDGKPQPNTNYLNGSYTYRNENSLRRLFFHHNPANQDKKNITIVGFESIGEFRNLGSIWSMIQKKTSVNEMEPSILMDNTVGFITKDAKIVQST